MILFLVVPRGISLIQVGTSGLNTTLTFIKGPSQLKQDNGTTNILFLGISGGSHDVADLSDSMIFLSFGQKRESFSVISIPRDLWIPSIRAKINTAYHYGEAKKPGGGGLTLAGSIVEEVTGQPVHYIIVADFGLFKEIVDLFGGINICVDRSFDDYKYPIPGKETALPEPDRYEHIHFDAGCQKMDGERALKFVRSRNAEGEEGTDFARSRHQEKVILALKNSAFSPKTLINIPLILKIKDIVLKNLVTNITFDEYPAFARMALIIRNQKVITGQIDQDNPAASHSGLLTNPPIGSEFDYQWVLIPKEGSGKWIEIQKYISNLTTQPN
jgi:LCP family protein required for cell wall assembly